MLLFRAALPARTLGKYSKTSRRSVGPRSTIPVSWFSSWFKQFISMDWFKGKSTGNHRFSHEILGFPVIVPLNQSIDSTGWWYTYHSEKYDFVSWDYYSQLNGKIKKVPNHQPVYLFLSADIEIQHDSTSQNWDLIWFQKKAAADFISKLGFDMNYSWDMNLI